jgi:glycosyltransferase involved in cell wall biosynthesis
MVPDLEEAAIKARELSVDILIFNNRDDSNTINGIKKLDKLHQPFILWDQNGPSPLLDKIVTQSHFLKRIVCVSKNHANSHRHKKFFPKITWIYNGVNSRCINKKNDNSITGIRIAYIGAIGETKGFQWVAKAWPEIKMKFPTATLTVIGSIKTHDKMRRTGDLQIAEPAFEEKFIKPYLGKTEEMLEQNGIEFTGHISPNQIDGKLKDVILGIVNPNINNGIETFCVSAIDFQVRHIPVIGGNAGGLKETVKNKKTGILINDSSELANVVIKLLSDPEHLEYLQGNCAEWVQENFSRKKIVEDWKNLIVTVLNGEQNKKIRISIKELNARLFAKELIRIKNNLIR